MPIELLKSSSEASLSQVQAVVLEEDTGLVLSADIQVRDVDEHPLRLMTELLSVETHAVGTAVLKQGTPHRILAIVHDLDQTPGCRQEWVVSSLAQVLHLCEQRKLESVAMQHLGCVFGNLDPLWFENQLLEQCSHSTVKKIWLLNL